MLIEKVEIAQKEVENVHFSSEGKWDKAKGSS